MALHRGGDETGTTVQVAGEGATGDGAGGETPRGSHRTVLRRAFNMVPGSDDRYLWYVSDAPPAGPPLEGIGGGGDSGGPLLVETGARSQPVGLASWNRLAPDRTRAQRMGFSGQWVYGVRISGYLGWIEATMSSAPAAPAPPDPAAR